jgi:hypothetical protein
MLMLSERGEMRKPSPCSRALSLWPVSRSCTRHHDTATPVTSTSAHSPAPRRAHTPGGRCWCPPGWCPWSWTLSSSASSACTRSRSTHLPANHPQFETHPHPPRCDPTPPLPCISGGRSGPSSSSRSMRNSPLRARSQNIPSAPTHQFITTPIWPPHPLLGKSSDPGPLCPEMGLTEHPPNERASSPGVSQRTESYGESVTGIDLPSQRQRLPHLDSPPSPSWAW